MGEVYRARDERLGRDVALKLLPAAFAHDAERMARFAREARLLASLNHPNIAALYGVEDAGATRALVLELVLGPTLTERISRGPLDVDEALRLGAQIAEALEYAHERGVIHRDLKPANVKLTPGGVVKLIDFGLAKALHADAAQDESNGVATLAETATSAGVILGSAAYMSPEQARGRPVDRRTDVWALGCVLYEMLTGRRAFAGETTSDVLAAVLGRDPDWTALPRALPARVETLLRRCLERDTARRWRDAGDARLELEDARSGRANDASERAEAPARRRLPSFWATLGIVALALVASEWWLRSRAPTRASRPVQVQRLTDFVGLEEFPALSPDGRSVAFSADTTGRSQLWVRLLAGGKPLQLTRDDSDHVYPRWSPDSSALIYFATPPAEEAEGTLWELPALGGSPRPIAKSLTAGDFSPDGRRVAFLRLQGGSVELTTIGRDGSSPEVVARLPANLGYAQPRWSPDSSWIAFQRGFVFDWDLQVVPSGGGEPRTLARDGSALNGFGWLPDSAGVVYSSARGSSLLYLPTYNLWSVPLDGVGARQLTFGETSYTHPDVDRAGRVVATRMRMDFDLWRFPVDGAPRENVARGKRVTRQTGHLLTPSAGPGDRELVYLWDSGGHANLWAVDVASGDSRQITQETDPDVSVGVPVWSPDGKHIAYVLRKSDPWNVDMPTSALRSSLTLWLIAPDGGNRRMIAEQGGWATWSSDSRWLYYRGALRENVAQLMKVAPDGGEPVVVRTENASALALSPDGGTLYYVYDQVPQGGAYGRAAYEIRMARPQDGPSRLLATLPGWRLPSWQLMHPVISPDGRWLAVLLTDGPATNVWAVSTENGALRQLTDFGVRPAFIARRVSWSSDGRSIFAAVAEGDADVVLLDGLEP